MKSSPWKKALPALAATLSLALFAACGGAASAPASAASAAAPAPAGSGQSPAGGSTGGQNGSTSTGGQSQPRSGEAPDAVTGATQSTGIGLEAARTAALAEAGLAANAVTFVEESTDWDDGLLVYAFAFLAEGTKYECEVNGADGSILRFKSNGSTAYTSEEGLLSIEAVKAIALQDAGIDAASASFTQVKLDQGRQNQSYFEVDFYAGGTEYEYKIASVSGEILSSEREQGRQS